MVKTGMNQAIYMLVKTQNLFYVDITEEQKIKKNQDSYSPLRQNKLEQK